MKEAWEKNPDLQVYSTVKTIASLQKTNIPLANLHKVTDGDVLDIDTIRIEFMETLHEGDQYADIQNLTLLINVEDKRIVVTGDAAPTTEFFQNIANRSEDVDWLFAPFPYIGLRSTRKLICENLNIKNIFVLHQPRAEADTQNWIANTKKVCELSKDSLPKPVFPEKLGERYRVN